MRVAAVISSRDTPRISRSRFRFSPKVPLVIFSFFPDTANIGGLRGGVNVGIARGGAIRRVGTSLSGNSKGTRRCTRGSELTILKIAPRPSVERRVTRRTNQVLRRPVNTTENFGGVERRRRTMDRGDHREAGEVAVFHELGKALTSSLQLDQVLRTIMEKIDEFLRPDTWSL